MPFKRQGKMEIITTIINKHVNIKSLLIISFDQEKFGYFLDEDSFQIYKVNDVAIVLSWEAALPKKFN